MSRQGPRSMASGSTPTEAKNYVAAPSGAVSTDEMEVGQIPDRVMRSTGDASKSLDRADIAMIDESPMDEEWVANMAFMQESVEVQIAETHDEQAEKVFEININGRPFFFMRGETKVIPRYVADHMLRMKTTRYSQKEVFDAEGTKDIVHPSTSSLKYPFMITRDDNPMGRAWMQFTMKLRG